MALQSYTLAVGNLQDDESGNNYAVNKAVYILKQNRTLQPIFSDFEGETPIIQNGSDNATNSKGEFTFFVEAGDYIASVGGVDRAFTVTGSDYFNSKVEEAVDLIIESVAGRGAYYVVGSFESGFTYNDINQTGTYDNGGTLEYYVYTGGMSNLPHTVPTGTNPTNSSDYQRVNYNSSSAVINDDGSNIQQYLDGQQFENVEAVKSYPDLSKLIGQRVQTKEYHLGSGIGGAAYDVVNASSVSVNGVYIIQGVADSGAAIVLVSSTNVDLSTCGAVEGSDASAIANAVLSRSSVKSITIKDCNISDKIYLNSGQTVYLDGDILIDHEPDLGSTASFADVMNASVFVNKRGFQTTLNFIGGGSIIGAITSSGNFLPNQNHNAKDDGEVGISIIQRSGRVYSNRVRYTPNKGPYALCCMCITENTNISLKNVQNMGACVFSYHSLNGVYKLQGEDIGTDYINGVFTTDLLGGSFGCVYLGKALNYGNRIDATGYNCNDVVTFDGICRSNQGSVVSYEAASDELARNHRVYELSDNCRGNNFIVTANGGGRFEHVVYQDNCDNNYVNLTSVDSQSRAINLRRECNNNTSDLNVRDWNRGNVGTHAIELFQSSNSEGCDNNKINAELFSSLAGKGAYSEIVNDAGKYHKKNDVNIKNTSNFILSYNFADTVGDVENGTLISIGGRNSESTVATVNVVDDTTVFGYLLGTVDESGQGQSSIRPPFKSQLTAFRAYVIGDFTGGNLLVEVQKFDGSNFTTITSLNLTSSGKDKSLLIRDRFLAYALTETQSYRFRVVPSSYTGSGCKVYINSAFSETA